MPCTAKSIGDYKYTETVEAGQDVGLVFDQISQIETNYPFFDMLRPEQRKELVRSRLSRWQKHKLGRIVIDPRRLVGQAGPYTCRRG